MQVIKGLSDPPSLTVYHDDAMRIIKGDMVEHFVEINGQRMVAGFMPNGEFCFHCADDDLDWEGIEYVEIIR